MDHEPVIDRVIRILGDGSPSRAALAIGRYPSQMTVWRRKGYIPAKHALAVEAKSGGTITAREVLLEAERYKRRAARGE